MQTPRDFKAVTIDKSRITTIGERLYAESMEFARELVNNAYDADATLDGSVFLPTKQKRLCYDIDKQGAGYS